MAALGTGLPEGGRCLAGPTSASGGRATTVCHGHFGLRRLITALVRRAVSYAAIGHAIDADPAPFHFRHPSLSTRGRTGLGHLPSGRLVLAPVRSVVPVFGITTVTRGSAYGICRLTKNYVTATTVLV